MNTLPNDVLDGRNNFLTLNDLGNLRSVSRQTHADGKNFDKTHSKVKDFAGIYNCYVNMQTSLLNEKEQTIYSGRRIKALQNSVIPVAVVAALALYLSPTYTQVAIAVTIAAISSLAFFYDKNYMPPQYPNYNPDFDFYERRQLREVNRKIAELKAQARG